jgi:transposase
MAYREVAMWEILEVLRRVGRGENQSAVARATGHSRKTVRRYVATAVEQGWTPGTEEPAEELAAAVYARHRPAAERDPGEVEERLLPHRDRIRTWLKPDEGEKRGLRLTKVHELLVRLGVHVPYSSLHRFAVKHCGFRDRRRFTVRRADCEPGEMAEVDFGRLGLIPDPTTGRRRTAWALVVTLGYSRHQYVHVTHSQKIPDLIAGLEDAWLFFGGVVRRLVIDNLKAAVTKADRYDPIFGRTFEEYAAYRGFVIDPAPPRMPTGKPVVERQVPYVRDSLFRGETWRDRGHLQGGAIRWCLQTAGTRIHGTTRKRPLAVFEAIEQAQLIPLTRERFDPPMWAQCTVHPDHHISFDKAAYSAPTRYVGHKVWIRADSGLVRLYAGGVLIKTHPRQVPGGRSTDYDDYPTELTAFTMRDPERIIRQARDLGPQIGRFAEALLAGTFPWAKLRQAQKLLRLTHKYGPRRLELACRRALAFELINVHRVESILRQELDQFELPLAESASASVIPIHSRFLRPAGSFSHPPAKESDHE